MAGEDHERRISTNEANIANFQTSLVDIKNYLEKLFNQQGEIKTSLALVVQNQVQINDYQKVCDIERADHEKRLTDMESFRRLMKVGVAVTGIGSMASTHLSKLWERIFG